MATQAECSKLMGISPRTFRDLIDRGVIVRREAGKYDPYEVVPAYIANLREVAAGRGGEEAQIDKAAEEARKVSAQADLAEMKRDEARGLLIPADQIADAIHSAVQTMKTRLLAIPAKAAASVGAKNVDVAEKRIREEIDEALTALARVQVSSEA